MNVKKAKAKAQANFLRYNSESERGHYESYFLRANHPTEARAFWIRYTIFSPLGDPGGAIGELWAIYFNGDQHHAAKKEFSIHACSLNEAHFRVEIADNLLRSNEAKGDLGDFAWDLEYESEEEPIFLLPLDFYHAPFPKAKSIVSQPFARFDGHLMVNGEKIDIGDWLGSQNHNWGEKHTDYYAWGQVAGFDEYPDTFLEIITAKLKMGPFNTPFLTLAVLRHKGQEYQLNTVVNWFRSKASFDYFNWDFETENKQIKLKGRISAAREAFVGLRYYNPPGGDKACLNSKIASCELTIEEKNAFGGSKETISTAHRCAFEILTDDENHNIEILF